MALGKLDRVHGAALDIGGSRVRLYRFFAGQPQKLQEAWLPERLPQEELLSWGQRRVQAITGFVGQHVAGEDALPTACAGLKDATRGSVVKSTFACPLPCLVDTVRELCAVNLGPLYDDDVCAGWGHLASPRGGLGADQPPTILLTAGTGVAEVLFADGQILAKGSYPRFAELGLEEALRASSWRDRELPLKALEQLVRVRASIAPFKRLVLSGRFADSAVFDTWPSALGQEITLEVCALDEAPALGALALRLAE